MKGRQAIVDLGARFDIETPHTGHVAGLAMDLFDGFAPGIGLTDTDRPILYAAACLHDIAYASDPGNHEVAGARILDENPVAAFSADEWHAVVGITLLHKRDWRAMLKHDLFPRTGKKKLDRIKKLAAVMRIADGLDHGHIQDARIFCCRRGRKVDTVGVECAWYSGNIPWAEMKADLWQEVFKRPFRVEGRMRPRKTMFNGVVNKKDPLFSAARRILYSQWRIMRDNVPQLLQDLSPEYLLAYRNALNRLLAGLDLFAPSLRETCADELRNRLGSRHDRMDPLMNLYGKSCLLKDMASPDPLLEAIKKDTDVQIKEAGQLIEEELESDSGRQAARMAARLLRVELPRLERQRREPLFADFAREVLTDCLNRITARQISDAGEVGVAQLIAMQDDVRQGLHCAEFCAPVLGKDTQRTATHLNSLAAAIENLRQVRSLSKETNPIAIPAEIKKLESKAWEQLLQGWSRFAAS